MVWIVIALNLVTLGFLIYFYRSYQKTTRDIAKKIQDLSFEKIKTEQIIAVKYPEFTKDDILLPEL